MNDADLAAYWPDLGRVVARLREAGHPEAAQELLDAVAGGATSSEILGEVGLVLRRRPVLRRELDGEGRRAWDGAARAYHRACPGAALRDILYRLLGL